MALRIIFNRSFGGSYSLYYCKCKAIVPRASFTGGSYLKSADDGRDEKNSEKIDQVINNLSLKFQKKRMTKFKEQAPLSNNLDEISKAVTNKRPRRVYFPSAVEDKDADRQIWDLIKDDRIEESLKLVEKLAIDNRFPSKKCLLVLVSMCSAAGKVDGIGRVREVCLVAFPRELADQCEYRHYEAEALWKSGFIKESLDLFYSVYVKHPAIRRKIANMSSFCFRHVIEKNLADHFSDLFDFVDLIAKLKNPFPASNLWRHAFCSSLFETQKIAEKLLDTYPQLPEVIKRKIPVILKESKEYFRVDLFQRLMTLAIRFQWDDSYEMIFGEYLNYLCLMNDVNGVKETLKYLDTFSMPISASMMEKCMAFIAQSKNSSSTLKKNFKGDSSKNSPIKFEF